MMTISGLIAVATGTGAVIDSGVPRVRSEEKRILSRTDRDAAGNGTDGRLLMAAASAAAASG
jgi:hypothetical protein